MTLISSPEAFVLLAIPHATLHTTTQSRSGTLYVEYVTFSLPPTAHPSPETPDVFLVLRVADFDTVLDPTRTITQSEGAGEQRYVFQGSQAEGEIVLILPSAGEKGSRVTEDLEIFQSILAEYGDYRGPVSEHTLLMDVKSPDVRDTVPAIGGAVTSHHRDENLRGRFVLVNEDNNQIISALDNHIRVQEDPSLREKGHENDPVVVELPEGVDNIEQLSEIEVLVRTVPPEERDWLLKGAILARCDAYISYNFVMLS